MFKIVPVPVVASGWLQLGSLPVPLITVSIPSPRGNVAIAPIEPATNLEPSNRREPGTNEERGTQPGNAESGPGTGPNNVSSGSNDRVAEQSARRIHRRTRMGRTRTQMLPRSSCPRRTCRSLGTTSADQLWGAPSQVPTSKKPPNPRTLARRPTVWRAVTNESIEFPLVHV